MTQLNYPAMPIAGDGTSQFKARKTIPPEELQSLFDAIGLVINGGLDEENFRSGTQIPPALIAAISAAVVQTEASNAASYLSSVSPGDSAAPSLPVSVLDEILRLRDRLRAVMGYSESVRFFDASNTVQDASWHEPPIAGPNLLRNAGFEGPIDASGDPPTGWQEVGTLGGTSISTVVTPEAGSHKRCFSFATTVSGDGFSQTIEGLKGNTKYLFGVEYTRSVGGITLSTAGGLAPGSAYQNFALTDATGSGVSTMQGIVQTNATGGDITVSVLGSSSGALLFAHSAWFHELGESSPSGPPSIPVQVATHDTQEVLPAVFTQDQLNWEHVEELDLGQYVPSPGYQLTYDARLSFTGDTGVGGSNKYESQWLFDIQMSTNGATGPFVTVDGPYMFHVRKNSGGFTTNGGIVNLEHVVDSAAPGVDYAFRTRVAAYNDGILDSQIMLNPVASDATQSISRARLKAERV